MLIFFLYGIGFIYCVMFKYFNNKFFVYLGNCINVGIFLLFFYFDNEKFMIL